MYKINIKQNIDTTPWNITCEKRACYLREQISAGYKIAVIVYEFPDTSTFRYRGYNMYQIMQKSTKWKTVYFFRHELDCVESFLTNIDVVILARVKWNLRLQSFINKVDREKIPLYFDVDDRIYDLDYLPQITNTLNVDFEKDGEVAYDFWFAQISRIEMTARQAHGYIGTNAYLANTFSKRFHKPWYIIPNFLNKEQLAVSDMCLREKKKAQYQRPFTIGYFSGTPSHINDFKIVYKEIMQLLYEYDEMELMVVGFMEFPTEMQELIKVGKVKFYNLVDFIKLQELEASVDVNIVPLVINEFTNCKSELKYFETAIVDTVTCASPSFTYKNAIKNGQTGFLCKPTEWYPTIRDIYLKKYDIPKIIENAKREVMENYYGDSIVKQIESVYDSIIERNEKSE